MLELLNLENAMFITTLVIIGHTSTIINLYIKRRAWLGLKTIDPSLIYSSLIYAKDKSETRMYFFILMQLRCMCGGEGEVRRCK